MKHVTIRPPTDKDMPFVYSSWLKSVFDDEGFKELRKGQYYPMAKAHVDDILRTAQIDIACDPETPDFIFGYSVYSIVNGVYILHWAYTKAAFRNLGIFRSLITPHFEGLREEPMIVTYRNDRRKKIFEKYKMVYKPEYRRIG